MDNELKNILQTQLQKVNFWIIDEGILEEIGDCIAGLMTVKLKLLSGIVSEPH